MAGMGSAAAGFKENRRKYQGNEYIRDFGLNWMDFQARQYDPQLGRFLAVDPLADGQGQEIWSPYAAMGNAPESMVDPNGESAYSSMAQDMMSQMNTMGTLGAMFGAGNFTVDAFGKIGIIDMKAAWASLLSFMSSGTGAGSAAATYTMGSIGFNILMNINNPNYNTFIGFAGNNFMAHESGSDLLLGSRLMAGNLPTSGVETAASRNGESVLAGFNETTANLTPMGLLNLGAKVFTGKSIYGDNAGDINTLEAIGPPASRISKVSKIATVEEQAAELSSKIGKNRVTLRSQNVRMDIDLVGKAHFDKATRTTFGTPHLKISERNFLAPNQPTYNTGRATYQVVTPQELRLIKTTLEA